MPTKSRLANYSGLIAALGLFSLVAGLVASLSLPEIKYFAWGVIALGVALLVAAFVLELRRLRETLTSRRGRFGAGTTVMALVFVGIILLANAISVNKYHRFELSALSKFTLTPQTRDVLAELNTPVQVLAFLVPDKDPLGLSDVVTTMLAEYQKHTALLSLEVIDPEERPERARPYGVAEYQSVVFKTQEHFRLVAPREIESRPEYAFTSAILQVTGTAQKKVYFLAGHDERDLQSTAPGGYAFAMKGLLEDLYQVETTDLITTPTIPEDAAVLVIAAPQKTLTAAEVQAIYLYLLTGGDVLVLADPDSPAIIDLLLAPWGVQLGRGTIIDPSSYAAPNKDVPTVMRERNAFDLPITYFPGSAAVLPLKEIRKGIQLAPLLQTTAGGWLERDFDAGKEMAFDAQRDVKGPLFPGILIAAAPPGLEEGPLPEGTNLTRLVVIGDSDFASNQHYDNGNNSDLFLDAISWLAEEKDLITVRHNVLPFRRLIVGPEVMTFIKFSSAGLLPFLLIVVGGIIWWRRR